MYNSEMKSITFLISLLITFANAGGIYKLVEIDNVRYAEEIDKNLILDTAIISHGEEGKYSLIVKLAKSVALEKVDSLAIGSLSKHFLLKIESSTLPVQFIVPELNASQAKIIQKELPTTQGLVFNDEFQTQRQAIANEPNQ